MRLFLAAMLIAASPTFASEIESTQDAVVDCLARIGDETEWAECRKIMFEPCTGHEVGSENHIICLEGHKLDWQTYMEDYRQLLDTKLTTSGSSMLAELMGQWFGYMAARCNDVAVARASISEEAAKLGCEIAELAGITAEFDACLDGRSTTPYCVIEE